MANTLASTASNEHFIDFAQPWELSDAVLVVEEERFHVHRCILSIWSPVFLRMFAGEFKEKTAEEIPLPGKKASEIRELLLIIYPTCKRCIDESNHGFLLDLAKEYLMRKLTAKCEKFLMTKVPCNLQSSFNGFGTLFHVEPSPKCLDLLCIAQEYGLEKLLSACINASQRLSLGVLRNHKTYDKISYTNYRKIIEGKMEIMEKELSVAKKQREVTPLGVTGGLFSCPAKN